MDLATVEVVSENTGVYMLAPLKVIIIISTSLQTHEPVYLNVKPYEPYTLNKVITAQDMYNTDELIERLFIQERERDEK
jgi:hypothetical protein